MDVRKYCLCTEQQRYCMVLHALLLIHVFLIMLYDNSFFFKFHRVRFLLVVKNQFTRFCGLIILVECLHICLAVHFCSHSWSWDVMIIWIFIFQSQLDDSPSSCKLVIPNTDVINKYQNLTEVNCYVLLYTCIIAKKHNRCGTRHIILWNLSLQ